VESARQADHVNPIGISSPPPTPRENKQEDSDPIGVTKYLQTASQKIVRTDRYRQKVLRGKFVVLLMVLLRITVLSAVTPC